jgi:hypothetical protein
MVYGRMNRIDTKVKRYLQKGGKKPHHSTIRAYARRHGYTTYSRTQSGGSKKKGSKNMKLIPIDKLVAKMRKNCNSCIGVKGGATKVKKRRSNTTRKLKRTERHAKSMTNTNSPFERCVLKVKKGQSLWCVAHNFPAYQKDPHGQRCVNPWAVCSSSISRKRRRV